MHYIKDIFEKNITNHTHNKFVRYSRGTFTGPLIRLKVQKSSIKIAASAHFIDELLYFVEKILKDKIVHVKGVVVWNKDLNEKFEELGIKYIKVSKSRGIFKYTIDNEVNITDFIEAFKNYNLLINIKTDEISMTTKSNFPKPNKEVAKDFCKCTFPISLKDELFSEFAFDIKNVKAKDIIIKHKIIITDIELPEIDDFEKARKLATRIGTLERITSVNGADEISKTIDLKV